MKKLLKNLGYQTVYQILAICLPLITSPYISRVLGADGLGVYSYTYSLVNYFTLFAMLGTTNYGSRSIAVVKENKESVTHVFWSIYALQIISSVVALIAYITFVKAFVTQNILIATVQAIWIIACVLDISWFFFGIEEFKVTVIRNIIIKLMTVVAIFMFVNQPGDVWKYTVIMALGTLLSQLALWPFLFKYIGFYMPKVQEVCAHIRPNILLFIPLLGLSVYHIMDKTMLGMVCSEAESGYYYNADKVMSMPLTVIMATGTVMLPKMSELAAKGDSKEENYLLNISMEGFMLLTIGMAFGISAVAQHFIPIFFGPGYEPCVVLVYIFSVIMIFKALANIIRNQFLIPHNYERIYTISVFVGAILNFIANCIFIIIMDMGAVGACYGTLVAEMATCILYIISINKETQMIFRLRKIFVYFLMGIVMFTCVLFVSSHLQQSIISLLIEIAVGSMLYLVMCLCYWWKNEKSMFHLLLKKLIRG